MLTFRRRCGRSLGAPLISPGLFILLTASAVLIGFSSCATNETEHVVDVGDTNLTAYYPEVQPADGKWHKVDPTKPLRKPVLVRLNDGVFNVEFVASPNVSRSAVTLIDGWNKGCQLNVTVDKVKNGYSWTPMLKAPGDKSFDYVLKDKSDTSFLETSGTLRINFLRVAKDNTTKIEYWSGDGDKMTNQSATVKCGMSTQPAVDDTLHSEQNIASIELSTEAAPGDPKVAPLEVKWEMDVVRFTSDEPVDTGNAAPGFLNLEITVAATVVMQMLLAALRD